MTAPLARHQNPDGTYDGAGVLAEITGVPRDEVLWTFERMKALLASGASIAEAKAQIKKDAEAKPWLK